jgi:large subunit ribosomal protein L22e
LAAVEEPENLESFLINKIKVNGKTGSIHGVVKVTREKARITVEAKGPFSKRYLKYLTKKYLKKQKLRDYFHVIASTKDTYEIRQFNINVDEEEQE